MDFSFYKNFLVIAETGNLTLAAKKLSLAQPALTAQLKQLEAFYGVKLVKTSRGKRSLTLTEAGSSFLLKAQQLCNTEEQLFIDMQSFQSNAKGTLQLSISPATMDSFMEQYLLPFTENNADLSYVLTEESVQEQLNSIRKGSSDLAYANAPIPDLKNISYYQLHEEHFFAVFHRNLKPATLQSITLKELQDYQLSCNQGCYGLLRQLCEQNGFIPKVKFLSTTGTAAARFASSGKLVAIVSEDCSQQLPPELERVPITNPDFCFSKTIFWSSDKELPQTAKLFLAFITTHSPK